MDASNLHNLYWILVRRFGRPTQVLWRRGLVTARADAERLMLDDNVLAVRIAQQVFNVGMDLDTEDI